MPGGPPVGPGGPPGTPSAPPVAEKPLPPVLPSSYYYQAGLRHDPSRLLPLVADDNPRHNARANVLFTDGSLRRVPCTEWYVLWKPIYRPTQGAPASGPKGGGED
ncbi:MAG: hypothetical protein ABFE08_10545 [Armatimonadia bacterium]